MTRSDAIFVYGSLLEAKLRLRLLGREIATYPARLEGYERRRDRYYYVVRREDAETSGLMIAGLFERDFEVLDRYESVPELYQRRMVTVTGTTGDRIECWCYLPSPKLIELR